MLSRPFFLMGESYGGVYVPTFTDLLLKGVVVSHDHQMMLSNESSCRKETSRTLTSKESPSAMENCPLFNRLRWCDEIIK